MAAAGRFAGLDVAGRIAPDRIDRLRTRLRHHQDLTAFVPERGAHLVGEIFRVNGREQFVAIDEEEKRRWREADLRGVEKFQAMALGADGLAALDRVLAKT